MTDRELLDKTGDGLHQLSVKTNELEDRLHEFSRLVQEQAVAVARSDGYLEGMFHSLLILAGAYALAVLVSLIV